MKKSSVHDIISKNESYKLCKSNRKIRKEVELLSKNNISYARDLVIRHSKDYQLYLTQYISECKKNKKVLDFTPYLKSTMEGIFYSAINEALWDPMTNSASIKNIEKICDLKTSLDKTGKKAGRGLHTPTYAAILIASSVSDAPVSADDTEELYALDKSVRSYFEMTSKKIASEL